MRFNIDIQLWVFSPCFRGWEAQETHPIKDYDRSKKPENYLGSRVTDNRWRTHDSKSRTDKAKAALNKKNPFTGKMDLNLMNKLVKWNIWITAVCGAENWTLLKVDQKCLVSSKIWCWGTIVEISWAEHVKNKEVLHWPKVTFEEACSPDGMNCTRGCNYSFMYSWWWARWTPETCRVI